MCKTSMPISLSEFFFFLGETLIIVLDSLDCTSDQGSCRCTAALRKHV